MTISSSPGNNAEAVPENYYTSPEDILVDDSLTQEQKRIRLQNWKQNEEALIRAAEEGMTGGESNHLKEIEKALRQLEGR